MENPKSSSMFIYFRRQTHRGIIVCQHRHGDLIGGAFARCGSVGWRGALDVGRVACLYHSMRSPLLPWHFEEQLDKAKARQWRHHKSGGPLLL